MQMKKNKLKGILFAMTAAIFWGFSGNCGQYLFSYKNMDPTWLTACRLLIAGSILCIFARFTEKDRLAILQNKRDIIMLMAFSIIGLAFCQYTYLLTISYSNAGTATVLQYLGPVFLLLFTCLTAKRWPRFLEIVAILLALGGTFLLATHGKIGTLVLEKRVLVWGIISAVSLMLYTIMPEGLVKKYGSTVVTAYAMLFGGVLFSLMLPIWHCEAIWDLSAVLALLGVVLPGTAIAYLLYLKAVALIGPLKTSLFATVEPLAAMFFSSVWLGTSFQTADYAGLVCISVMVILLTLQK